MRRWLLFVKYFYEKEYDGRREYKQMCSHANRFKISHCYHRANYLYWRYKDYDLNPKILKYHIKNNNEEAPFRKLFKHISGDCFGIHFVLKIENEILDPNLHIRRKISEKDYNKYCIMFSPAEDIIVTESPPAMSQEDCNSFFK